MLYYLKNETILWSESVYTGLSDRYSFEASKTVIVQPMKQGNQISLAMNKASDGAFKPKSITVPVSSVVMISDCTDDRILTQLKATLSGLILPGKNGGN